MNTAEESLHDLILGRNLAVFRDQAALQAHLNASTEVRIESIGISRKGQPLFGMSFGTGPRKASIIAGCHADEPVGVMTAQALPAILQQHCPHLLKAYTFFVVPQMNPDGARANHAWFNTPPDFASYIQNVVREEPGDDIEFGFGQDGGARPEALAAMSFLSQYAPFSAHFSLHGMPYAEGAWFLLCREWAERSTPMMRHLIGFCRQRTIPLHDMDRHGEKGFTRIRPGFSTSPTSIAMRTYFQDMEQDDIASRFRPSSMEFIQSISEDPLCMVSEPPLFLATRTESTPSDPVYLRIKKSIADTAHLEDRSMALNDVGHRFGIEALPLQKQMELQAAMIIAALNFLEIGGLAHEVE